MTDKEKKARLANIRSMRRKGMTLEDIGKIVGLSAARLSIICSGNDIPRGRLQHTARFLERPEKVRDLYVQSMRAHGYTLAEVAKVFDISRQQVSHIVNGRGDA